MVQHAIFYSAVLINDGGFTPINATTKVADISNQNLGQILVNHAISCLTALGKSSKGQIVIQSVCVLGEVESDKIHSVTTSIEL